MHPPKAQMAAHIDRQHWQNTGIAPSARTRSFLKYPRNCSKDGWPFSRALAMEVWLVRLRGYWVHLFRAFASAPQQQTAWNTSIYSAPAWQRGNVWLPLVSTTEAPWTSTQHWQTASVARRVEIVRPPPRPWQRCGWRQSNRFGQAELWTTD